MTSTYLYGLDDEDIPDVFLEELGHAMRGRSEDPAAVMLWSLLDAGWVPPSKAGPSGACPWCHLPAGEMCRLYGHGSVEPGRQQ